MEEDIHEIIDRGESVSEMDPMQIGNAYPRRDTLTDLVLELAARSEGFKRSLPDGIRRSLADLVRAMNCYYSNLIEGHYTRPVDIERALRDDFSSEPEVRDLQLEAKAHIEVQEWIDGGGLHGRATTAGAVHEIHRRFCQHLPEELLWIVDPETGRRERVLPGVLRESDVKVSQHLAISPGAVPRFLVRFEEAYNGRGNSESVLATAAAHHRLLWIHPFLDGNGRVARLLSHAIFVDVLDTGGVWSVARGLARNVGNYKSLLANCDLPRRNDLDGRGALSEEALARFTEFFLNVCIDQVEFMEHLVQPTRLRSRIVRWAEEEVREGILPQRVGTILEAVLYRGELPRGEVAGLLGTTPRHARRIVSTLIERGVLRSDSVRSELTLAFPAALASQWMPGLFPEQT